MRVRRAKAQIDVSADELPDYSAELHTLKTYLVPKNITADWQRIMAWFDSQPETTQALRSLVQQSADMALRAQNLYLMAKEEEECFTRSSRQLLCEWRAQALQYWEDQKSYGLRKQITERMIEDYILETYPTQYLTVKTRESELTQVVTSLKKMSERVVSRGSDLRKLLDAELRRPSSPKWFDDGEKQGD